MDNPPLISFDYAIKYLLKDKSDYSIVEGFISALLKTQGYNEVKIIALLETESTQEDPMNKRSVADVIVEDEHQQKYIIEIERILKNTFIHKACFNTSRLIIDNIPKGHDYHHIIKVFHISLLYFSIGNGPVYHGKTIIHEIETKEKLTVHMKHPETGVTFDATDILPEYFVISVPAFNDRLEKEIDEWLYVMKHENVPDTFRSPYMKLVAEKLSILKMTAVERQAYYAYQKQIHSDEDGLRAALDKGKAQGIEEGKMRGKEEIALTMLELNLDINLIVKATGLSLEHIQSLISSKK